MADLYRETIPCSILLLLLLAAVFFCHDQAVGVTSIYDTIVTEVRAQVKAEFRERYKNAPRIVMQRGTIYTGEGEIVIERVK